MEFSIELFKYKSLTLQSQAEINHLKMKEVKWHQHDNHIYYENIYNILLKS